MIVDEPFAAPELVEYLVRTQEPVLANGMGRKIAAACDINLLESEEFAARVNAGERLICTSENSFDWVAEHVQNQAIVNAVATFKDKGRMRELLTPMYPGLECRSVAQEQLGQVEFGSLQVPFVLKPTVGYCSAGVYVINSEADWNAALADIQRSKESWREHFTQSALRDETFIVEPYLRGTEYAVDAYFDEDGRAVVLDVLRHEFSRPEDTTDRCYVTGPSIIREFEPRFAEWLNQVNEYVHARNFPVHVETRIVDGRIVPIEFNPLRFAGICGTEVAWHGYGFHTYDYFLHNVHPDWNTLLAGKEGKLYCMGYLLAPEAAASGEAEFDFDAFEQAFSNVKAFHRFDVQATGAIGFIFIEADEANPRDIDFLRDADFSQFCC